MKTMLKEKQWKNGNKMVFNSKHKTFNKQCRCIGVGNQISDVTYSNYIRAFSETKCSRFTFDKGHLQNYDLTRGITADFIPSQIKAQIKNILSKDKDKGAIVYHFHHWRGEKRIDDGIVLTTEDYKLIKVWYLNLNEKAIDAINEAIKYIAIKDKEYWEYYYY